MAFTESAFHSFYMKLKREGERGKKEGRKGGGKIEKKNPRPIFSLTYHICVCMHPIINNLILCYYFSKLIVKKKACNSAVSLLNCVTKGTHSGQDVNST